MRPDKKRRPGGDPVVALRGEEEPEVLGLRFGVLTTLPLHEF
jgi:hypothetical protein